MGKIILALGADPEFFLINQHNQFISAEGLVGGTKEEPRSLDNSNKFFVQEDNVMVEFNIPPSNTISSLKNNIHKALKLIHNIIPNELMFSDKASAEFSPEQLLSEQALTFGCDPDLDVWNEKQNEPPCATSNLRTAGGHIHVSYDEPSIDVSIDLIKYMDVYLGIPSIIMDTDDRRKSMYGKAGAFRFKFYGFEYRTLSNFWIWKDEYIEFVFNQIVKAFDRYNNNPIEFNLDLSLKIQDCINNNNKELAKELIKQFNIL